MFFLIIERIWLQFGCIRINKSDLEFYLFGTKYKCPGISFIQINCKQKLVNGFIGEFKKLQNSWAIDYS